jgi:hypothetical protein
MVAIVTGVDGIRVFGDNRPRAGQGARFHPQSSTAASTGYTF